ncbi:leucyl/phenylalanyl-tRNA--protein transferase [Janibacter sp. G1551]|uniref:leucyl/phenylalanyl-tRNA--protein transferase n=1 Tax=Janibacter sp. G1551 TaxID=3420440 RepID=UPI003D055734
MTSPVPPGEPVPPFPPREPPPGPWALSLDGAEVGADLVALGADLAPGTLLAAYRTGLFPMGVGDDGAPPIGWWSPDPRGVLLPGDLRVSRSLRRAARRFTTTRDAAFADVVAACGDPSRDGRWITEKVAEAYLRLHRLGWAHSVEVWDVDGALVGGLYGVATGGLFAGESMFHRATDASKVALLGLVEHVFDGDDRRIIDVQWATDHLVSLGVREVPRSEYLVRLRRALEAPDVDFTA